MKTTKTLFIIFILGMPLTNLAQKSERNFNSIKILSSKPQPHFVLKANDETLEIPSSTDEKLNLSFIDPNSIESVHVFKDKEAIEKYGANGKNGVVIISFKAFDRMPLAIQEKFKTSSAK